MIRIWATNHEHHFGRNRNRGACCRHSPLFVRSLPAITLAGVNGLRELHRINLDSHGWSVLGVGLLAGSISTFIAIWGLMQIPERFSSWPFVWYRAVIGSFLVAG
jgi:undecaprenyl-diphosphatase